MMDMRTVNIYALTRIKNIANLRRIERQMSGRNKMLTIKKWEFGSLTKLIDRLMEEYDGADRLNFFYSFQMPKLGKEFDLLRISEDTIINIELKSDAIADERIKKQLLQNRYYLSYLGKNIRSYTYISNQNRLVRLTNSENLIDVGFDVLIEDLIKQTDCFEYDIEHMFKEENYIISPLADSERFLQKEYFLTSQQKDIEKRIQTAIREYDRQELLIRGFKGLPGTGKTLLLYDIAMNLSYKQKVCVFHCGSQSDELDNLDKRLKRINFYHEKVYEKAYENLPDLSQYSYFLVDEAHLMSGEFFDRLTEYADKHKIPVILSYANEDSIAASEKKNGSIEKVFSIPGYEEYKLTNRIRANAELSSFIQCLMQGNKYNHRKDYPSVSIVYANNVSEAALLMNGYIDQGYMYISDSNISNIDCKYSIDIEHASCIESDCVAMLIDSHFTYDNSEGLTGDVETTSIVRNLFHGLNRAKCKIAVVVLDNEPVCDTILNILQGYS